MKVKNRKVICSLLDDHDSSNQQMDGKVDADFI